LTKYCNPPDRVPSHGCCVTGIDYEQLRAQLTSPEVLVTCFRNTVQSSVSDPATGQPETSACTHSMSPDGSTLRTTSTSGWHSWCSTRSIQVSLKTEFEIVYVALDSHLPLTSPRRRRSAAERIVAAQGAALRSSRIHVSNPAAPQLNSGVGQTHGALTCQVQWTVTTDE
jgi:hypothetical protein